MTNITRDPGATDLERVEDELRGSAGTSTPDDRLTTNRSNESIHIREAVLLMRQALTCFDAGGIGIVAAHLDMAIQTALSSAKLPDFDQDPSK